MSNLSIHVSCVSPTNIVLLISSKDNPSIPPGIMTYMRDSDGRWRSTGANFNADICEVIQPHANVVSLSDKITKHIEALERYTYDTSISKQLGGEKWIQKKIVECRLEVGQIPGLKNDIWLVVSMLESLECSLNSNIEANGNHSLDLVPIYIDGNGDKVNYSGFYNRIKVKEGTNSYTLTIEDTGNKLQPISPMASSHLRAHAMSMIISNMVFKWNAHYYKISLEGNIKKNFITDLLDYIEVVS